MTKECLFKEENSLYLKAKDHVGICKDQTKSKLILMGSNSLDVINYLSITEFTTSDECKFIILYKKKFLDEVLVFKINPTKFILLVNNYDIVYQTIKKTLKHFPLTVICDGSMLYSYFTFHGKSAIDYFSSYSLKYLFIISHQGYFYYHLLTSKEDENQIFKHFLKNKFINLTIETKRLFLYNNKVIPNFNKISKRYILHLINAKYNPDIYSVNLYDILDNQLVFKNNKIVNFLGKKVGLIYCSFTSLGYFYYNKELSKVLESNYNQVALVVTSSSDDILYVRKNKKKDIILKKRS